jgi:RNA polymerase sigma-70 factor, ECF subfamily
MSKETEKLALAAANGDQQAVEVLLERHLPGLRAFVRLRAGEELRQKESSSDLVQSVCREVLQHIDRFQYPSEAAFRQWLYTTAMRKIMNRAEYWRTEKRGGGRNEAMPSTEDDAQLMRTYKTFSSPSKQVMLKEELERIERAFQLLPDEYREVITLAHIVGLSRAEIAVQMGKSEGAVRVLLHRALAKVSELLEPPRSDSSATSKS